MSAEETKRGDWDAEAAYDNEISPLMTQIIAVCKEHRIPVAATFQYKHDEEGPGHCTTVLAPREWEPSDVVLDASVAMRGRRPVMLAETHVTNPDGSKTISVRRVS